MNALWGHLLGPQSGQQYSRLLPARWHSPATRGGRPDPTDPRHVVGAVAAGALVTAAVTAVVYAAARRPIEAWVLRRVCSALERHTGLRASSAGVSCPACLVLRGRLAFRGVALSRAASPAPFALSAESVVLTLSPLRWLFGRGLVSAVDALGVRGEVDLAARRPQQRQDSPRHRTSCCEAGPTRPRYDMRLRIADARVALRYEVWSLGLELQQLDCRLREGDVLMGLATARSACGTFAGGRFESRRTGHGAREIEVTGMRLRDAACAGNAAAAALLSWVPDTLVDARVGVQRDGEGGAAADVWAQARVKMSWAPALWKVNAGSVAAGVLAPLVAVGLKVAAGMLSPLALSVRFSREDMGSISAMSQRVAEAYKSRAKQ